MTIKTLIQLILSYEKFIISLILSILFFSCTASSTKTGSDKSYVQEEQLDLKQRAEQLKKVYQKLSSSGSLKMFEQEYFEVFPNSFIMLNGLFGYTDKEPMGPDFKPGPLYNESNIYIEAFFKLDGIEKIKYYTRIIDISTKGKWYADGINYFKHGMETKFKSDINIFCELLSKRTDIEIKGFWYFYFDKPHPLKKLPNELLRIKQINERIYQLMVGSLKEVQLSWKE